VGQDGERAEWDSGIKFNNFLFRFINNCFACSNNHSRDACQCAAQPECSVNCTGSIRPNVQNKPVE
jgi:hypothetical protein